MLENPHRAYANQLSVIGVAESVQGYMGGQCSDDGAIFVGNPATFSETDIGFINAIKARYYKLVRIDWVYGQENARTHMYLHALSSPTQQSQEC